jgi:hypothetical protein
MLNGITELADGLQRHPGGHNFPDMEVVIDPSKTAIEDGQLYLVQVQDRSPVVKKCKDMGATIRLDPALAAIHGQTTVEIFGRKLPCQGIEFSDNFYKRYVTVHGKVVGLWAGASKSE